MNQNYLDKIRGFEGFAARATWDYQQNTNGYGTKARYAGEVIDTTEAERRFQTEIENARAAVTRFAPKLDEGSAAALTSLTFNAGQKWMTSGLGQSIKTGDLDTARAIFKTYVYAGGQVLPGLQVRRLSEAEWFGTARNTIAQGSGPADRSGAIGTTQSPDGLRRWDVAVRPSEDSVSVHAGSGQRFGKQVEPTTTAFVGENSPSASSGAGGDRSRDNSLVAAILLHKLQMAALRASSRHGTQSAGNEAGKTYITAVPFKIA
jgi:GH24 family phage-related lysozyme (muramidase)